MRTELLSYLATACWAEEPEDDNWQPGDVSPGSLARAERDLRIFATAARIAGIDLDGTDWCHDFWLTRNGHGAGFWDGDWDYLPNWRGAL